VSARRADGLPPTSRAGRRAVGRVRVELDLPLALVDRIDVLARGIGLSRSAYVRRVLEGELDAIDGFDDVVESNS